jgi:hypothetical protein
VVGSHYLAAETLSASLEVLSTVDGIQSRDVTINGGPAVEVTHIEV